MQFTAVWNIIIEKLIVYDDWKLSFVLKIKLWMATTFFEYCQEVEQKYLANLKGWLHSTYIQIDGRNIISLAFANKSISLGKQCCMHFLTHRLQHAYRRPQPATGFSDPLYLTWLLQWIMIFHCGIAQSDHQLMCWAMWACSVPPIRISVWLFLIIIMMMGLWKSLH